MHLDGLVALAGLVVGFVVGLTGMGGGALMTPVLVLLFNVKPLAAVPSDLVAAVIMKPIGGTVHMRRGTVNLELVKWLCVGSVPSAFAGVLLLDALGNGETLQHRIKVVLGVALLVAATAMVAKAVIQRHRPPGVAGGVRDLTIHKVPTLLIGATGGFVVGITSVGSGSLMMVLLLWLYPRLTASQLVGTDLVQAVPLVGSAALGHLLFGDFELGLTTSLLIGSVPGVYLGARASAKAPDVIIRPVLVSVLSLSALKLLDVSNGWLGAALVLALTTTTAIWVRAWKARAAHEEAPVLSV